MVHILPCSAAERHRSCDTYSCISPADSNQTRHDPGSLRSAAHRATESRLPSTFQRPTPALGPCIVICLEASIEPDELVLQPSHSLAREVGRPRQGPPYRWPVAAFRSHGAHRSPGNA